MGRFISLEISELEDAQSRNFGIENAAGPRHSVSPGVRFLDMIMSCDVMNYDHI